LATSLDPELNAKAFTSTTLDLGHPGVKIITMHSAKGLQFPIVAVTGMDQGMMPRNASGGMDRLENSQKQRRLFFVACSRAMWRLLVCGREDRPSEFLKDLDEDHWELYEN
jgi:superfamily I DNA/RNA helicase